MFGTVLYLFRLLSRTLHIAIKARHQSNLDIALRSNIITLVLDLKVFSVVLLNDQLVPAFQRLETYDATVEPCFHEFWSTLSILLQNHCQAGLFFGTTKRREGNRRQPYG
jgi:hypothetical protein